MTNARSAHRALTVSIGITGHRMRRLSAADIPALRLSVNQVLREIKAAACALRSARLHDSSVELVLVSSLASGSDSLVANEAVALGFSLHAPLPFSRLMYREDFNNDAERIEFDRLLAPASVVQELDGNRENANQSYLRASVMMLQQCNVLLAVRSGDTVRHVGGTADTLQRAVALGIPVLCIDSSSPHQLRALRDGNALGDAVEPQHEATAALARAFPQSPTEKRM